MIDLYGRPKLASLLDPAGRALARTGLSPTVLTILGLFVTVGGAVLIGMGELVWGAIVAGIGAFMDALDGPLARAQNSASIHGAFVDTMSDRLGEIAVLVGLFVHVHDDLTRSLLTVLGMAMSLLVPYVRSRAEAAGAEGRGGWMGRAERNVLILAGVGLSALIREVILDVTLWLFVVLVTLTVAQRIRKTWDQLTA